MSREPRVLRRIREHPDAPRWTQTATDRLGPDDLEALEAYRLALARGRGSRRREMPEPAILQRVAVWSVTVPWLVERLAPGLDLERDWALVPTMARRDVATEAAHLVPDDADLDRLVVYRTAGTTGHPLLVPHHPRAAASYLPLLEVALARHGAACSFGPDEVACFLLGAQARTVTYPCLLQAWGSAGFAKLNLRQGEWPAGGSQARFAADLAPRLLTGDPISFAEMLRLGIAPHPGALVTTAVAMSTGLRRRLEEACGCPVIDWYSLTETGPLGYRCPLGTDYHVLPHDLHVEVVRPDGSPCPLGERGEIAVTGGRNPYLPLVRYRTGDHGFLVHEPCACGDPMPRLVDLEGRAPVLFRAADGSTVNPVDLARTMRELPLVQHVLTQHADLSVDVVVRLVPGHEVNEEEVRHAVCAALGEVTVTVRLDPALGDRDASKLRAWSSELLLED